MDEGDFRVGIWTICLLCNVRNLLHSVFCLTVSPGYYGFVNTKIKKNKCIYMFFYFLLSQWRNEKKNLVHTHSQQHTVVVSLCPIPAVLRCYLSLTCHGCQILMDGKQIGAARETRAPGHKQSFPLHLAIRSVSAATHSCWPTAF